jgi:hydroxymethylglutaryl-CoA lyase
MAKDDLVGNIATETILSFLESEKIQFGLDKQSFSEALSAADEVFGPT